MKALSLIAVLLCTAFSNAKWTQYITGEDGKQINQFDWIMDTGKWLEGKPWPKDFKFPPNYRAEFDVYYNTKAAQYQFKYRTIVDSLNNRLKVDATKYIFQQPDRQVHVYDFEKKHLYVGSPQKNMCQRYDLEDLSPPSLVRRQSGLNLRDMIQDTWSKNQPHTQYLGRYRLTTFKNENTRNSSGVYHVFRNRQTFIEPERDLGKSATGAYTFYYFNDKFQLVGGATVESMTKANYFFTITKFEELNEKDLKLSSSKFEVEFILVECIDYFKDEYMLINGF